MTNALNPSPNLLCKLGSIIVHADELLSPHGHHFDLAALQALIDDPEVAGWIAEMGEMALVPLKRNITAKVQS